AQPFLEIQRGAFLGATVRDPGDAIGGLYLALYWQWARQAHELFGVKCVDPVELQAGIVYPEARMRKNQGESGQGFKVFFVDIAQLLSVQRVGAKAYAKRVENGIPGRIAVDFFRDIESKHSVQVHG